MTATIITGLVLLVCCVQGELPCLSSIASCIPIKKCWYLSVLASCSTQFCVDSGHRTNDKVKFLNQSHCRLNKNNSQRVICANEIAQECVTLENNAGICKDIQSCPVLANLLKPPIFNRNKKYVSNHRCDDKNNNRICCTNCNKLLGPPQPRTGCCGISRSNGKPDSSKIITAIDQYPWMALIEHENWNKEISIKCAGNLISSKYVLTSAICVTRYSPSDDWTPVSVRLGEYDTSTDGPDCIETDEGKHECTDGAISVPIDTIIKHHSFIHHSVDKKHDIALLKLKYDVPYTDFIRPICLPSSDVDENDMPTYYAAGWGAANETGKTSDVKLQVDLPFVPLKNCTVRYSDIWEGQICAGGDKGKSTCYGDAGGPLMSYNGFYEIVGIISYGVRCGVENYPEVFTKVYHYLPWIRSHIEP